MNTDWKSIHPASNISAYLKENKNQKGCLQEGPLAYLSTALMVLNSAEPFLSPAPVL